MTSCPIQPLRDRIVVDVIENETITESGLVIPDAAQEKPQQGTVLAVGSGHITETGAIVPLAIEVGDRVMFSKQAGESIKIDGKEYFIMREDAIVAIIRG